MRYDKEAVFDMLFSAFEKHQYYNIRDLVKITRQPIVNIFLIILHEYINIYLWVTIPILIIYSFILFY